MFNLNSTIMAKKVFTCILKQSRGGMPAGTSIQVTTGFASPGSAEIANECERLFGRKARDASYPGYWDIKSNI
jgi:hypothetical protein